MRIRNSLFILIFPVGLIFFAGCGKRENPVTFETVCREKNEKEVELSGFLLKTSANGFTETNFETSQSFLLVEHKNGTGGFIKVVVNKEEIPKTTETVKIVGKVLKNEDLCVLQVEKIETP